ncbi:MAG: IS3 family transposase, partial [Gammaproteobacteria bacterium]
LDVSTQGYYAWRGREPSQQALLNAALDEAIARIYWQHKGRYGAPRIWEELQAQGIDCSENRVARRLQALGLKAIQATKFKVTTDSEHAGLVAPDLVQQDFTASGPNQKWVSDITYVWTGEGWLYLAVVMDLYSRAIIGWSLQSRMTQQLVCDALTMALFRRGFPKGVIVHSDRGSQYGSKRYQKLLRNNKLLCSMGRTGCCYDNAAMESFFHSLKVELIHRESYNTRDSARQAIFEYIEVYYNRQRRHSAIGYQIPMVFEDKQKRA